MSRKSKGINAERELIHSFWKHGFAAVRIAGSGSMKYPSADILAANKLKRIALECKTCSGDAKYIPKEEINQLRIFSEKFGAQPWIAVKFSRTDWLFISPEDLDETGSNFRIDKNFIKMKGLLFEELISL